MWAGIASRTHLIYGASWIRELLRLEPGDVRVELMGSRLFFGEEAITPQAVLDEMPEGVDVVSWRAERAPADAKLWMLSVGAVGIKPWLALRKLHPLRRFPVVVTDEGIGTYGNWSSRHQAYRRQQGKEPWITIRTTAVEGATRLLGTRRWALHIKTADGWALNKPVADEFRRQAPSPNRQKRVVFLSQPWPELGVMRDERYRGHIAEVAQAAREEGFDFKVLPHPGEDISRHAPSDLVATAAMAELNPDVLGASVVVGASSTALLNVAAIHGVPAWRVGTPELDQLDRQLAPRQASLLAYYASPAMTPPEFGRRLSQSFGHLPGDGK